MAAVAPMPPLLSLSNAQHSKDVIATLVRVSEGLGERRSVLGALRAGDAVAVDPMDFVPEPRGPGDQLIDLVVGVLGAVVRRHPSVDCASHIVLPFAEEPTGSSAPEPCYVTLRSAVAPM